MNSDQKVIQPTPARVESASVSALGKAYWADRLRDIDVCIGCGLEINYDHVQAIVATQLKAPLDEQEDAEQFILCPECGTDVDKLVAMGMKRIIYVKEDRDDITALQAPNEDEVKQ